MPKKKEKRKSNITESDISEYSKAEGRRFRTLAMLAKRDTTMKLPLIA